METESVAPKKRQRRSTPAEKAEVLEQFHRSGLSRTAFSRNCGIALSTLNKWLTNARRKSEGAGAPIVFTELKTPPLAAAAAIPWAVEMIGVDGLTVRCREPLPLQDMAWLLRGR
jgi:lambda repressor-like predicted transcriptional regulator